MAHFYKLMQQELFLQSWGCKAFEHFLWATWWRGEDTGLEGMIVGGRWAVGGPPPGAKVWVSQSWPTQTLATESSSPLRILGLWLDEKGDCIFRVFLPIIIFQFFVPSSAHQQAIICNLIRCDIWRLICPFMWSVICSPVRNLICPLIWSVICFAHWRALPFRPQSEPGQRLLTCCPTKLAVPRWYWSHHYLLRHFRMPLIFQRF